MINMDVAHYKRTDKRLFVWVNKLKRTFCVFMFYVNKGNMITRNKLSQKIQKDVTKNIIRLFSHILYIYQNEL